MPPRIVLAWRNYGGEAQPSHALCASSLSKISPPADLQKAVPSSIYATLETIIVMSSPSLRRFHFKIRYSIGVLLSSLLFNLHLNCQFVQLCIMRKNKFR